MRRHWPRPAPVPSAELDSPLIVYSRIDLNQMLLSRAIAAGAEVEKTRVVGIQRNGEHWI